ncbi:hypothetical protein [Streptomyces sp. GbtcB6]|uniref:hypothetical protein n=1 Tax=Streptomyces sp. GbtcB6 TaxID=2824751 RepID=UPI001C2FA2D0|nr:hypothetical protein [Streptomyces sp. GbtcB6]
MSTKSLAGHIQSRLGVPAESAAWCKIGKIPAPPKNVHRAAGDGPLRPALIRPLGALGMVLIGLLSPLILLLYLLSKVADAEEWLKASASERATARTKAREAKEGKATVRAQRLDQVFDGDWNRSAGQFLLHWYSQSSHHTRVLALTQDRIVLAAPPKRVSVRQERRLQVVASIPATEAVVEDPLDGLHKSGLLRIRFRDGSWLTVLTEELRSEVHKHLMRQTRSEG